MTTERADRERRPIVQEAGDLRKKNQITLPRAVATALGVGPGDRVMFVVEEGEPGEAHLYRMPRSFAGIAPHAYGGDTSSEVYVRAEREAWEE
jgi:bifunctional DNA-binding transcriptional regulator/antitoxin component of YhaV-PrlF toxin-antitoxin module